MTEKNITIKIKRQDKPASSAYWQTFKVPHRPFANIISCLMEIQKSPKTENGETVTPVAWDCNCLEEVCGSCTMVINGQVRSMFLGRVIHFGETLGDQVNGRSPKKPKSLIEVPNVVHVNVQVLSFNMILISSR